MVSFKLFFFFLADLTLVFFLLALIFLYSLILVSARVRRSALAWSMASDWLVASYTSRALVVMSSSSMNGCLVGGIEFFRVAVMPSIRME